MKVLVIAAHMDDEVLGVGGTIAKHVQAGHEVCTVILSDRAYQHRFDARINKEERAAARSAGKMLGCAETTFLGLKKDELMDERLLDIIVPLEEHVQRVAPDIVYTHHRGDSNQDHRAVFSASIVACRVTSKRRVPRVLCYEVPSSTDIAPAFPEFAFQPNHYVDIAASLKKKIKALKSYARESRKFPHPRSLRGIEVLAQKRGMECGCMAAEGFMLVRDLWC